MPEGWSRKGAYLFTARQRLALFVDASARDAEWLSLGGVLGPSCGLPTRFLVGIVRGAFRLGHSLWC